MSALINATCQPCHGSGVRLHGWAVGPGPCRDCRGTGVVAVNSPTTDLAAHLDTRLAPLTPAQRTIAARHLQGACTLLNLTRNTSQAAWLNAVDEACQFGAAS